jgi:hypothetical protein
VKRKGLLTAIKSLISAGENSPRRKYFYFYPRIGRNSPVCPDYHHLSLHLNSLFLDGERTRPRVQLSAPSPTTKGRVIGHGLANRKRTIPTGSSADRYTVVPDGHRRMCRPILTICSRTLNSCRHGDFVAAMDFADRRGHRKVSCFAFPGSRAKSIAHSIRIVQFDEQPVRKFFNREIRQIRVRESTTQISQRDYIHQPGVDRYNRATPGERVKMKSTLNGLHY